jgi:uncharacterized protein YecA (UPF0149 family)
VATPEIMAQMHLDESAPQLHYSHEELPNYRYARCAGANDTNNIKPLCVTAKFGRNDPCHCGSGKKFSVSWKSMISDSAVTVTVTVTTVTVTVL